MNIVQQSADGICYTPEKVDISYPADGNDTCFAVEEHSFWFKHRNDCIIEAAKAFPPVDNRTIFDIGGGNGFVSRGLMDAGFEVVLVEPGRAGAINAKKRGISNVICATAQTAGFRDHSLPGVGLFDVLEHIEDDKGFLKSMHGLLKNDAPLYLTVPAYNILWSHEDDSAGHYRRYALNRASAALKSAGFEILYATYIFRFLPPPIFFFRTLPYKLGFSRRALDSQKIEREHAVSTRLSSRIINYMLASEVDKIRNKKIMRFGGSCLIVAKK